MSRKRSNRRIAPGHYEFTIDGHTYTIMRVVDEVVNGKELCSWEVSLDKERINFFDMLADAIEYIEGLHREARKEYCGYRMLPE